MKKLFYLLLLLFLTLNVADAQWVKLNSGTSQDLNSVYFTNPLTGYIVGDTGTILKTTNGGALWITLTSGTLENLWSVYFTDTTTGYVVGSNGTILKTINGGKDWAILNSGIPNSLFSVYFPNANSGYVVGTTGTILKTTDGGTTWISQVSGNAYDLFSVYFTSPDTGFVVGGVDWFQDSRSTIRKTTNGGTNWTDVFDGYSFFWNIRLLSVYFPKVDLGYAVGENGTILKSADTGKTWIYQTSENSGLPRIWSSVYFTDPNNGFVVGQRGLIMQDSNGDSTWGWQTSWTSQFLNSVYFTDAHTGFVVGDSGIILKTTDGGNGVNEINDASTLLKIYPNPTSNLVTIETSVMHSTSQLSIMNLKGQVVLTRQITRPKTLIDISSLASGFYVVRVTNDRTVEVGKIVKN
jgi:photosystem II stability/assembly factor-like uncharacterized protein